MFGEEKWKVISVMLIAKSGNEYDYTNNFKELDAAARTDMIKNAVKKSKVKTDVTGEDIDSVELTDNFLTLVTPYSKNSSKVVVVVAERIVE